MDPHTTFWLCGSKKGRRLRKFCKNCQENKEEQRIISHEKLTKTISRYLKNHGITTTENPAPDPANIPNRSAEGPVTGGGGGGGTRAKISSQSSGIRFAGTNFRPAAEGVPNRLPRLFGLVTHEKIGRS